jgi:hypothetical protein
VKQDLDPKSKGSPSRVLFGDILTVPAGVTAVLISIDARSSMVIEGFLSQKPVFGTDQRND